LRKDISAHHRAYILAQDIESWAKTNVHKDFFLGKVILDWSNKRTSSRGGLYRSGPGINIAMATSFPDNKSQVYRFYEYRSYDSDSIIGGFYSANPYHKLRAIVAHEMAHAIQFFMYNKTGSRCKPHGPVFKKYYKELREEFVNKDLPNQKQLASAYLDYINKPQ